MNRVKAVAIIVLSSFTINAQTQTINTQAQVPAMVQPALPASSVTASVTSEGKLRVVALGEAQQIRLEIYSVAGELVSDSGLRAGNIIDWKLTDANQAMPDGSYLVVVTTRDLKGNSSQRIAGLSLQNGQPILSRQNQDQVTTAQAQVLESRSQNQKVKLNETANTISILRDGKERAVVVNAHDGTDGQVTSTNGALTFRTGNLFSNREQEQMRITPDGKVGIGTKNPEATLDVAGPIRARGGIQFDDGTVINSAKSLAQKQNRSELQTSVVSSSFTQNLAGNGTTGKVAKWTDNVGTLGDSQISENVSGFVGIGNPNPTSKLSVVASAGAEMRFDQGAQGITPVLSVISQPGSTTQGGALTLGAGTGGSSFVYSDNVPFYIVKDTKANVVTNNLGHGTVMFSILPSGNVGIGVQTPQNKLEVSGNIKMVGVGTSLIFGDGTSMNTAPSGGGSMTGTAIVNAINDPATAGLIGDNRMSLNLGRLNGANVWTNFNTFNGLSANNAAITNVGNPVNGGDAVNKNYLDANAVKFVPAAAQLSVGDQNGTAPMINLRGQSTCCGPTTGFADFKVFQNGSFVASGNLGIGTSPMEGKGYRTSWHTYKGAFRSGYADNEWDDVNVGFFSWAGGSNSTASGLYSFAFGDTNFARSTSSIAFGSGNEVKGAAGFSAGAGNRVCDTYGVALGNLAKSGGPFVSGKCDTDSFNITGLAAVAIGYNVSAEKDHSFALGKFASTSAFTGSFVWGDGSATSSANTFYSIANNEFAARASGGFRFRTNATGTTGCNLPAGSGVFNCTSSRYTKENFTGVKGSDVLTQLRGIKVSTWNYISEGRAVRHMGPMAEDFFNAFHLGTGNTSIGVQDLTGVSLAAIKELDQRTEELQQKTTEVEQLRDQVKHLTLANTEMEKRLATLEGLMLGRAQPLAATKEH